MKLFCIFSHKLTLEQRVAAGVKLGVAEKDIHYLPSNLQAIWSDIAPQGALPTAELDRVAAWLDGRAEDDDWALIQGDSGAVFYLVSFCFWRKITPIYATTERVVVEEEEEEGPGGTIVKKAIFCHVNFREYERFPTPVIDKRRIQ